jgi:hypothetical protein
MSDTLRPVTTAEGAIGMERNLSVVPRAVSATTPLAVSARPNTIVMPNRPGMRNSR